MVQGPGLRVAYLDCAVVFFFNPVMIIMACSFSPAGLGLRVERRPYLRRQLLCPAWCNATGPLTILQQIESHTGIFCGLVMLVWYQIISEARIRDEDALGAKPERSSLVAFRDS